MVFLQLKEFQNVTLGITTARLTYRYQSEREGNVFNYERARMPEHKFIDLSITINLMIKIGIFHYMERIYQTKLQWERGQHLLIQEHMELCLELVFNLK